MADPDGTPIWFELVTNDQDAAERFAKPLFDWSVATSPLPEHGGYRMATAADGEGVAGVMAARDGMPTGWLIYFGVADVDAMAERVKELGGRIHMGPMDIPQVGRFVFAADPQGVGFYLMTGSSPEPSTAFKMPPSDASLGHGVWIELATPDPDAALDFYGALFGWSKQGGMPMGDMGEYSFIGRSKDASPGAIMSSTATNAPARWNWYVHVPDIDAAVETARAGGGSVFQEPMQIPGGDYAANLADAEGSQIGIVGPRKA